MRRAATLVAAAALLCVAHAQSPTLPAPPALAALGKGRSGSVEETVVTITIINGTRSPGPEAVVIGGTLVALDVDPVTGQAVGPFGNVVNVANLPLGALPGEGTLGGVGVVTQRKEAAPAAPGTLGGAFAGPPASPAKGGSPRPRRSPPIGQRMLVFPTPEGLGGPVGIVVQAPPTQPANPEPESYLLTVYDGAVRTFSSLVSGDPVDSGK